MAITRVEPAVVRLVPIGQRGITGAPGGNWYDTKATAAATSIPGSVTGITTFGNATLGDGGHASWVRVVSQPTHTGKFQSADSGWWALAPGQTIRPEIFGAYPGIPGVSVLTDQGAGLRAAISYCQTVGAKLSLAGGAYGVARDGTNPWCLQITRTLIVEGNGEFVSFITPLSTVPSTVDTLRITPDANYNNVGMELRSFAIMDAASGKRQGNHGVSIDTGTGSASLLPAFTMQNVGVGLSANGASLNTGRAVYHTNSPSGGVQGGLYASRITDCSLYGGILFNATGDSVTIRDNRIITAVDGVQALDVGLTTTGGGAGFIEISSNSITNSYAAVTVGSAIRISQGLNIKILDNLIEFTGAGVGHSYTRTDSTTGKALVSVDGGVTYVMSGEIKGNRFGPISATGLTTTLYLAHSQAIDVDDNSFLLPTPTCTGVEADDTAADIVMGGGNRLTSGVLSATPAKMITDRGIGTRGSVRAMTLIGGWAAASGYAAPRYMKDKSGMVRLMGSISGGTSGTACTTLPVRFRPDATVAFPNGIAIDSGGVVYATGSGRFDLNGLAFIAADLGGIPADA